MKNIAAFVARHGQCLVYCSSHGRVTDVAALIEDSLGAAKQKTDSDNLNYDQLQVDIEDDDNNNSSDDETTTTAVTVQAHASCSPDGSTESVNVRVLYGELGQTERLATVNAFRKKKFSVLCLTDVETKNLDFPLVPLVSGSN